MYIVKAVKEDGSESCGMYFKYWSLAERYTNQCAETLGICMIPKYTSINIYDIGPRPPIMRIIDTRKFWLDAERLAFVKNVPVYRNELVSKFRHVVDRNRIHAEDEFADVD